MSVETVEFIGDLVSTNPTNVEAKQFGDDHIRAIKKALRDTFAGWPGTVLITGTEAQGATENDYVLTVTPAPSAYTTGVAVFLATHSNTGAVTLKINSLAAKTLKDMDGAALASGDITSGAVCIVYYNGTDFYLINGLDRVARSGDVYLGTHDLTGATVTVATQSPGDDSTKVANTAFVEAARLLLVAALALKANIASPTFTGVPAGPTAAFGASGTQLATLDFVNAVAANASLPGQTGKNGFVLATDGTSADWLNLLLTTNMLIKDATDATKKLAFALGNLTTATTRTVTPVDEDITLFTPYARLLSITTASNSSTVEIDIPTDGVYDRFILQANNVTIQNDTANLQLRFTIGGTLITTTTYLEVLANGAPYISELDKIIMFAGGDLRNSSSAHMQFTLDFCDVTSTTQAHFVQLSGFQFSTSTHIVETKRAGRNSTLGVLSKLTFNMDSGNIMTGKFRLYGVRNS